MTTKFVVTHPLSNFKVGDIVRMSGRGKNEIPTLWSSIWGNLDVPYDRAGSPDVTGTRYNILSVAEGGPKCIGDACTGPWDPETGIVNVFVGPGAGCFTWKRKTKELLNPEEAFRLSETRARAGGYPPITYRTYGVVRTVSGCGLNACMGKGGHGYFKIDTRNPDRRYLEIDFGGGAVGRGDDILLGVWLMPLYESKRPNCFVC